MIASQKKVLILAVATLILAVGFSSLYATETRVGSMGGIGFYTHDNSNIFFFPGAISKYNGQVIGEFRVKDVKNSYTVGVNYPATENMVLGAYLNRPISLIIPGGVVDAVDLDHTTDFFLGLPSEQYDIGFRLSLGLDSHSIDTVFGTGTAEHKQSAYFFGLGAGISSDYSDLAVNFDLPHAKNELDSLSSTWSGFGFGLNARAFMGGKTKFVPLGILNYRKTNTKNEPGTAKTDYTDMNLGLGLGLNQDINESNMLVMAIEILGLSSLKTDVQDGTMTKATTMTFPGLYMGLDSSIKSWLKGRIGVAQVFQSLTTKTTPNGGTENKVTTRSAPYNVTFGLGFKFSDFVIDAGVNEGLFFDGPNFISGETNPMATRLSATYQF